MRGLKTRATSDQVVHMIHLITLFLLFAALSVYAAPATQPLEQHKLDYETPVDPALQKQIESIDASLREKLGIKAEETNVAVLDLNDLRLALIHPDHED